MRIQKYIFYLLIFSLSCSSKNSNNFSKLKEAFIDWYNKNHLTENFNYDFSYFNVINNLVSDDYIEDINRFQLELSQINKNKLNSNDLIDFEILIKIINRISRDNFKSKGQDFTINDVIVNIHSSFYFLMNNKNVTNFNKVIVLKSHLSDIEKYLNNSKNKLISNNKSKDIEEFTINYNILVKYIDFIIFDLSISDDNYKDLNSAFYELLKDLNKYNNWVNYDYSFLTNNYYVEPENNVYKQYISELFNNKFYDYEKTINYFKNKSKIIQNDIFNESLSIYLNFNDEPIWIDKSDTLNVVNWIINNKISANPINEDNLLNDLKKNYSNIVEYYKEFKINSFDSTLVSIKYKEDYEIISDYYLNGVFILNDNISEINLNSYNSNNLIFENFFSMHNIYGSLNSNINQIRNIENKLYTLGISLFLNDLYISDLKVDTSLNKISFYLELLKNIEIALMQDKYNNNLDEKIIKQILRANAFLSNSQSLYVSKDILNADIYYIEPLLAYFHLLKLYEEKVLISGKLDKKEFLEKVFSYGYVNYYTIK